MKADPHWCIAEKCTHGTLNGSLQLGSNYLREFNNGYAMGRKEALQDLFGNYFYHHDTIKDEDATWCLKHLPRLANVIDLYVKVNDEYDKLSPRNAENVRRE